MKEHISPQNQGIRLVETGTIFTAEEDGLGALYFITEEMHPYETQDLFHMIQLSGWREDEAKWFKSQWGLAMIGNTVVVDNFPSMFNKHKDFFHIIIIVEPFNRPGQLLRCDAHIDGFETYYTSIMDPAEPGKEDTHLGALSWQSSDPNDPNEYCFMVSPNDTALLSQLQFSFYAVPAQDKHMTNRGSLPGE